MVFESVVVELLNRYLNPYVKKLDTSQLKVGVWKGHASLDKLELKEDLFAEAGLDVPLKIKRSFVGKLELQIPWKRLTKDSIHVMIDEMYVILGPNLDSKYDPEKDLERQRSEKEKMIEKFKSTIKKKNKMEKEMKKGKKKKESEKPDTFVEKLAVHLTKNLQVLVRDIHVRYEDDITKPGTTMAAGATLHSLEVKSTDSNWMPTVVREAATLIYKLVELNCLGVYWNPCDQSIASLDTPAMINEMRNSIARPAVAPPPSNAYLLSPLTATAKLKMNVKIDGDLSMPELVAGLNCGDILFSLQQEQLTALLTTVERFERYKVNQRYLKYKPDTSLREDKKGWWKYAIAAVLEEDVKRRTRMWSWKHMKEHRDVCIRYQHLYYEKLHSHSVSSAVKEELQELEDKIDWFNIMVYRKAAKKQKKYKNSHRASQKTGSVSHEVERGVAGSTSDPHRRVIHSSGSKEAKKEEKARKEEEKARAAARKEEAKAAKKGKNDSNKAFFSKLKAKFKKKDNKMKAVVRSKEEGGVVKTEEQEEEEDDDDDEEEAFTSVTDVLRTEDEEVEKAREQLYKDIGYVENDEWKYPKEYVGHEVHLNVGSLTLELLGRREKIGNLATEKISVDLFHRPATNAISIFAGIGSLVMTGIPLEGRETTIITSLVGGAKKSKLDLVNLQLEISPIEKPEMDIIVKGSLRPIQIIYDFATMNSLIEMFKPPKLIHFQELTQAASASWEELKSQTSASLKKAMKDRKQLELDIELQSPFLVIPEKGQFTEKSNLIIVDLGKLNVHGHTTSEKLSTLKTRTEALDKYYDTFTFKLDGMQVLVARPGEKWMEPMLAPGSSDLHILDPTGFEIAMLKSIVDKDAYLPTVRVEGTLPGFEVKISDVRLASLIKVAATLEKPPALITITDAYDTLPPLDLNRPALDNAKQMAKFGVLSISNSLTTITSSIFDEDEEGEKEGEEEEEGEESPKSLVQTPPQQLEGEDIVAAHHVYTDASVKFRIKKLALKLVQSQVVKKSVQQKPLLDVVFKEINMDIVDRKWDTQGTVTMNQVAVLDHITLDPDGKPSYLVKTDALNDGNFISIRFVTITRLGYDFAAKYTGLQDTVSAQLSMVKIRLHQKSLSSLLQLAIKVTPEMMNTMGGRANSPSPTNDAELTDGSEEDVFVESVTGPVEQLNPNDLTGGVAKKRLDLHFDVKFDGIDACLLKKEDEIVHMGLTGFSINGRAQVEKVSVNVCISDFSVVDKSLSAQTPYIIAKAEDVEDIVSLEVVQYNHPSYERDPNKMDWVDTKLKAEIGRINVNVDTSFVVNILEFVKDLNIKKETFQSAAKATAETATVTANAIVESTKTAHRIKMDILFHAPKIHIIYSTEKHEGGIYLDLGDFRLSNRLLHASELESKVMETLSLISSKTVLDCMEIKTSSIQIYRKSRPTLCSLDSRDCEECHNTILDPIQFTLHIRRNISQPNEAYPNVDIILNMDSIKFHLHEEDVHSIISIGMTASKIATLLSPPPTAAQVQKERSRTLNVPKLKRRSSLFTFNTSRPRSTTAAHRWKKAVRQKRFKTYDGKEVVDVKVSTSLKSIVLEFTTIKAPLFKFTVSDLSAKVDVFKSKVDVCGSVDSLSLIDLGADVAHSKVVSLDENTNKMSSFDLTVSQDENLNPLSPLGSIKTNIAELQLVILTPFVLQIVQLIQRLDPKVLKGASKAAQDGAIAVTSMAIDKYFKVEVTVNAPVVLLPVSEVSDQCFMIDMGSLAVQNTLLIPDKSQVRVGIDAYGIKLESFKVSRVLLDTSKPGSPVIAERVLLQPFYMLLALERNLCTWYKQIPTLSINLNLGKIGIFLGKEDLEQFYLFGMAIAEEVKSVFPEKPPSPPTPELSEEEEALQSLNSTALNEITEETEKQEEVYEAVRIMANLPQFEINVFKDEPRLTSTDDVSKDLKKCEKFGLASLQLVTMDLKVHLSSIGEVEVQASMKDICLCDNQEETKKRNTGNHVVQHYTSNPLEAFTGIIEKPLITISYHLRADEEHNLIVNTHSLLILSDVEFVSTVTDYFRGIFGVSTANNKDDLTSSSNFEKSLEKTLEGKELAILEAPPSLKMEEKAVVKKGKKPVKKALPKLKCQLTVSNFRVAIIEDVYTDDAQALTLRLASCHAHVQLSKQHKHASITVTDLGISTSSFFDLDNTTSWVLLPFTLNISMMGPPDLPAMEINGTVDPISLTLSPAIVRLIIHAIQTLVPEKKTVIEEPPRDLWMKKVIGSKFWFLEPVLLHKTNISNQSVSTERKGEVLTLSIESIEIILENEGTSTSHAHPVLALNSSAVIQVFEWTGQLEVSGDINMEATYFNHNISLWEPLLETLERKDGKQEQWNMHLKVEKAPPKSLNSMTAEGNLEHKPEYSLEVASTSPAQFTLTTTSLELMQSLGKAYSEEYGKKVEGGMKIQSLTGAPYTVVNKLGGDAILFVQPGPALKVDKGVKFSKLNDEESADLLYNKMIKRKSYTSLVAKQKSEEVTIDIAIGNSFRLLKKVAIDTPGLFYYKLVPKEELDATMTTYGVVIEVAVTGMKKTVTVRSPLQFKNHLQQDIDIMSLAPSKGAVKEVITVLKSDQVFYVPIDLSETHSFFIRPTGFGFTPVDNSEIVWKQKKDGQSMDLKCVMEEDDSLCFFSRVVFHEEKYKIKRNIIKGEDFSHHIFDIFPPLIMQNLLPHQIFIEAMQSGLAPRPLESGQSLPIHELDLGKSPDVRISVIQNKSANLKGKFKIEKKQPEYATFPTTSNTSAPVQLSLHAEDRGYLKLGVYCTFWMINKTGLTLEYKDGGKVTRHPHDTDLVLLSTSSHKSKIQLRAVTKNKSETEWTKSFAVNAVGTSGNFSSKLGENIYRFGVEISLSKFTLTKMVMITPYYLIVNKTKSPLRVHEVYNKGLMTDIPPDKVVPYWTLNSSDKMVVVAGDGEKASSAPFNFKKSDNTVLQFDNSNEVLAVCVDVQESESAIVITFSPYFHGCIPVLIINHFPDVSLRFSQNIKDRVVHRTLSARESLYYTWDDPLGKKAIRWDFPAAKIHKKKKKPISVTKDGEGDFIMTFDSPGDATPIKQNFPTNVCDDTWIEVDETFSEHLVNADDDEEEDDSSETSSVASSVTSDQTLSISTYSSVFLSGNSCRGFWKSFNDGIQRVLLFTLDESILRRIKSANSFSLPLFEASLSLRAVGLSLVDNKRKRELTYISISPSGVIWQLDKGKRKRIWKTLNHSVIAILEEAYQANKKDIKHKDLIVNLETMTMYSPLEGRLRRTNHEGINFKFTMSETDFAIGAKIGYMQVDNQLPFSIYPQVLYPLPPPPTVASTTEPKPFVEASIIMKKPDQSNVTHFKYVHVLVQKISLNVDLGFILAVVDFFSLTDSDPSLEEEYVKESLKYTSKSLMETVVPELEGDISSSRIFFDVLHLSPIKIKLSFNIRSVGKNKDSNEVSVGDHFVQLFLHSIGVILTSVQDTELGLSLFHLENQAQTGKGVTNLLAKHYRNQALFELYSLIFGLDVLGNPVSVVRGVVIGAKDLFYEPFKGSVLGPEEFFEGLGLGLASFFGTGIVGGLTGAGAKITGAFGDVFAKLSFDDEFIEQRQQEKAKSSKLGWKLGGFAKNVFEGVTGVVTQPVKGLQKEGAVGLLKGTGKGLVGLLVRPTGGLVDLASGTLAFVQRKTKVGNFEVSDVRPPRFIGRDGVILPYNAEKSLGAALLVSVDEGTYAETDYYVGHMQVQPKPIHFLIVTDRRMLLIERKILTEGWTSFKDVEFHAFESPLDIKDLSVIINYSKEFKNRRFRTMTFKTEETAKEVGQLINQSYMDYLKETSN